MIPLPVRDYFINYLSPVHFYSCIILESLKHPCTYLVIVWWISPYVLYLLTVMINTVPSVAGLILVIVSIFWHDTFNLSRSPSPTFVSVTSQHNTTLDTDRNSQKNTTAAQLHSPFSPLPWHFFEHPHRIPKKIVRVWALKAAVH